MYNRQVDKMLVISIKIKDGKKDSPSSGGEGFFRLRGGLRTGLEKVLKTPVSEEK